MFFHTLGIIWADEWNHSTCISCLMGVLVYSHSYISFCPCTLFLANILSKPFASFKFSSIADCAFCALTLLAYARTCSLVTLSFSSIFVSFYFFYAHKIVIQPMYKPLFQLLIDFLVVTFCGGYSKLSHPLFCT